MLSFSKNKFGQVSIVTLKLFKKDEIIFDLNLGEFFEHPNIRTIELAPYLHVENPYGHYTNHHCDPTCYVDKEMKLMRASRDIKSGEEINFDYMLNETRISSYFKCNYGAKNCRKFIFSADRKLSQLENESI